MEKKITLGDTEVVLKSSAATNILYKKAFGEDIIVKLSSYTKRLKELQSLKAEVDKVKADPDKTDEEVLETMNRMMNSDAFISTQNFANETLPKLAYIMYAEANMKVNDLFKALTEESYLTWLMTFSQDDLLQVTGEVMALWSAGAKTHSKPKN